MKYFVYNFIWKRKGHDNLNFSDGMLEAESILEIYKFAAKQEEYWCLTSISEITKEEYKREKDNFG
jgi:hypothetical protein